MPPAPGDLGGLSDPADPGIPRPPAAPGRSRPVPVTARAGRKSGGGAAAPLPCRCCCPGAPVSVLPSCSGVLVPVLPFRFSRPSAAMRKFFQEIKADLKFKTAGPGQKLSEPSRYGLGGVSPVTSPAVTPSPGTTGTSAAGTARPGPDGERGLGVSGIAGRDCPWQRGRGRGLSPHRWSPSPCPPWQGPQGEAESRGGPEAPPGPDG